MKKIKSRIQEDVKAIGRKGSFAQNIALVFSGSAASIVLQIILTPIITRIYSEEHYGVFAVFNAIVMNCSLFGHLFFSSAFVLPKRELEFHALLRITVIATTVLSGTIFIATVVAPTTVLEYLNINELGDWKYLIGPAVFISALVTIIDNWTVRLKAFKPKVVIGVSSSVIQRGSVIGAGLFFGPTGIFIILGDLIGKVIRIILNLWLAVKKDGYQLIKPVKKKALRYTFFKYKEYPAYYLPANFLTRFSGEFPVFFLVGPFGLDKIGAYVFCLGMLDLPMKLLGNSVTPVFLQKTAEISSDNLHELREISKKLIKRIIVIGVFPFAFINVFGDWIFAWFFGADWEFSGTILLVLGHYYYFYLICNPFTVFFRVLRKEQIALYAKIVLLGLRLIAVVAGVYFNDFMLAMILLGILSVLFYIGQLIFALRLIKLNPVKPVFSAVFAYATGVGICWALKIGIENWFIS